MESEITPFRYRGPSIARPLGLPSNWDQLTFYPHPRAAWQPPFTLARLPPDDYIRPANLESTIFSLRREAERRKMDKFLPHPDEVSPEKWARIKWIKIQKRKSWLLCKARRLQGLAPEEPLSEGLARAVEEDDIRRQLWEAKNTKLSPDVSDEEEDEGGEADDGDEDEDEDDEEEEEEKEGSDEQMVDEEPTASTAPGPGSHFTPINGNGGQPQKLAVGGDDDDLLIDPLLLEIEANAVVDVLNSYNESAGGPADDEADADAISTTMEVISLSGEGDTEVDTSDPQNGAQNDHTQAEGRDHGHAECQINLGDAASAASTPGKRKSQEIDEDNTETKKRRSF